MKQIKYLLVLIFLTMKLTASAQIGYQVSLLNNATGEPRANERVSVTIKITDSKGNTLCEETKDEVSNDFGVLSMSVGNGETFANANWGNFPFFIEATVDGRTLGKSQLLSVPVAEHAKHTGSLTKGILCSKEWKYRDSDWKYHFYSDGRIRSYVYDSDGAYHYYDGQYYIQGNLVYLSFYDRSDKLWIYLEHKKGFSDIDMIDYGIQ